MIQVISVAMPQLLWIFTIRQMESLIRAAILRALALLLWVIRVRRRFPFTIFGCKPVLIIKLLLSFWTQNLIFFFWFPFAGYGNCKFEYRKWGNWVGMFLWQIIKGWFWRSIQIISLYSFAAYLSDCGCYLKPFLFLLWELFKLWIL